MTTIEPIFERLAHDAGQFFDVFKPSHYHHGQITTTPGAAAMILTNLINAIEQEARNRGLEVSADWHNLLADHLTIANTVAHVADGARALQDNPFVQMAEKYAGLPPALVTTMTHVVDVLAADAQPVTSEQPAA